MRFVFMILTLLLVLSPIQNVSANVDVDISSSQALLYNLTSDEVVFEKNSDDKIAIENLSILMTTVLFLDELKASNADLNQRIQLSDNVWNNGGINMFLEPHHEPTLKEILEGLTVVSGNDAAIAAAEYLGGDVTNFVQMMNEKAVSLSMVNTTFASPHGTTQDTSTSQDLSKLVLYLLEEHEDYLDYFSQSQMTYKPSTSNQVYKLDNQNSFLHSKDNITGLKSGWGQNFHLITTATIDNMDFLIINLGEETSTERNNNANRLMNYASEAYDTLEIGKENDTYLSYYVYKSDRNGPEDVVYKEDLYVYVKSGIEKEQLSYQYEGDDYLSGGLKKGDTIGRLIVSYEGKILGEVDIITTEDYPKSSFFSSIFDSIAIFFNHVLMDWVGSLFD